MVVSAKKNRVPDDRPTDLRHYIDPGFVNHRLIETVVGQPGIDLLNRQVAELPDQPEWMEKLRVNHIYTRVALEFCRVNDVPSLGEVLAAGKGRIFCSTHRVMPAKGLTGERATAVIRVAGDIDLKVRLEFSTTNICSDTMRSQLRQAAGAEFSIVAAIPSRQGDTVTFQPLVMGSPWLESDDPKWADIAPWWGRAYYHESVESFDEFQRVAGQSAPARAEALIMKNITERAFKTCLAEILGETPSNDWGGETSDHYTAHLHLRGRRLSGAFLLKGPAHFGPMKLTHLGKNNDQIYRLAQEPADVLFVQHCHEITPAVRATLQAFAVQPSRPRRYCLIDGRDSLRLLKAYGKLQRALELSSNEE